eukprot:gb/GEZJ01009083.1/.p1 GENE.gb/GEZJ01009083.1/~~gb/GEZJ01009083.1/.p1  ORF type:complete len:125 (+),score=12.62 gb/GEZJ01009083.1/:61-435(+)
MAQESNAATLDTFSHLIKNLPDPRDLAALAYFKRTSHTFRALILSTVPSRILNLFSIGHKQTPKDILYMFMDHLKTNTKNDHNYLKSKVENLHFTTAMTIDDYVDQYHSLRACMISSQYPNIPE